MIDGLDWLALLSAVGATATGLLGGALWEAGSHRVERLLGGRRNPEDCQHERGVLYRGFVCSDCGVALGEIPARSAERAVEGTGGKA